MEIIFGKLKNKILKKNNVQLILLLILYQCISNVLYCQKSFYTTDSVANYGVSIISNDRRTNSIQFLVEKNNGDVCQFTPHEVKYYCIDGKLFYKSFEIFRDSITSERYFLNRLVDGHYSLYVLILKKSPARFYIYSDSLGLTEIVSPSINNITILNQLKNVGIFNPVVYYSNKKAVKFNTKSLSKLVQSINNEIQKDAILQKPNLKNYLFPEKKHIFLHQLPFDSTTKNVLLQEIVAGENNLYKYKLNDKSFFIINKDSNYIYLCKENDLFRADLKQLSSEKRNDTLISQMKYNESYLKAYVKKINSNDYSLFQSNRIGVSISYTNYQSTFSISQLNLNGINYLNFNQENFKYGIIYEFPINRKYLTIITQLNFTQAKNGISKNYDTYNIDLEFDSYVSTVSLQIRQYFNIMNVRPFANFGVENSLLFTNQNNIIISKKDAEKITVSSTTSEPEYSFLNLGYSCGLGLEFDIYKNKKIQFEFRKTWHQHNSSQQYILRNSYDFSCAIFF